MVNAPPPAPSRWATGWRCKLVGSLVPDVVIHLGDPLRAQAVYDFKFPCVNSDVPSPWRVYPKEHPHADKTQQEMYREALNVNTVSRVLPRLGVIP